MFNRKFIFLSYLILMLTLIFPAVNYAQEQQNDLESRLKQLDFLRQSGQFTEEELSAAKKKILESVTKLPATVLQIDGAYLVSFQELSNNTKSMDDLFMPGQKPLGEEMSVGTKLWVIKQEGEQVNIDEYIYIEMSMEDMMDLTKSGPTKQFVQKLPITKVVIDGQIARIRYSERSRAPDGSIMINTTSLALRDNGKDGFSGEYERTIEFHGGSLGSFPMVAKGTISLIRDIEDNNSNATDLNF